MELFERLKVCIYAVSRTSHDSVIKKWARTWLDGIDRTFEGTETAASRGRFAGPFAAKAAGNLARCVTEPYNRLIYESTIEFYLDIAFELLEKEKSFDLKQMSEEVSVFPDHVEGKNLKLNYRPYLVKKKKALSPEEYTALLQEQDNRCAICKRLWFECKKPTRKGQQQKYGLVVDHCHSKGPTRGLLCTRCNLMLGSVRENPILIKNILSYLEKHA